MGVNAQITDFLFLLSIPKQDQEISPCFRSGLSLAGRGHVLVRCFHTTQFEIECITGGQSMVNFRFFSCRCSNYFTSCHTCFLCTFYETYKKMGKKDPKSTFLVFHLIFIAFGNVRIF